MTNELSAYNEGFRDGQAQGCTNEMHLVATHNLPLVEADLAAERIENTRLREAFVTMEQAANQHETDLAAARCVGEAAIRWTVAYLTDCDCADECVDRYRERKQ